MKVVGNVNHLINRLTCFFSYLFSCAALITDETHKIRENGKKTFLPFLFLFVWRLRSAPPSFSLRHSLIGSAAFEKEKTTNWTNNFKDDAGQDFVERAEIPIFNQDETTSSSGQDGLDPHSQIAQLLRRGPQEGHLGHVWTSLQQEFDGIRQLRSPLLRQRLQHPGKHIKNTVGLYS